MSYPRGNRTGGNSGKKYARRGAGSFGGRGDSARPEMHQAICDECAQECEVPFKPSGDKPVFCRKCFKSKEEGSPRESSGSRSFGDRDSRPTMHQATCSECGQDCEVPFRPSGEKPVYCRACFGKNSGKSTGKTSFKGPIKSHTGESNSGMTKEQFETLNSKLDKILDALSSEQ